MYFPHICLILNEEYKSLSSSLCSFLCSPVTFLLLGPDIFLSTLFWSTPSLWPSPELNTKLHTHRNQKAKIRRVEGQVTLHSLSCIAVFISMQLMGDMAYQDGVHFQYFRDDLQPSHPWQCCWFFFLIPLLAWTGPEGSRRLRLPDFKTVGTWKW